MKNTIYFIFLISFSSCASVNFKERDGFDIKLNSSNYQQIKGNYSGIAADKILPYNFQKDKPPHENKNYKVAINPVDQKHLSLTLFDNEIMMKNVIVKGRYQNGYFKLKRKWNASFVIGPLIWVLGSAVKHIGLTNENNLVVINSGGGGVMLLILFPIFGANGAQYEIEYKRVE